MSDFYGLPEYFINCVTTENAGNGNIRVFNYVRRAGQLIPQFTCVLASADLIVAVRTVENAAIVAFNDNTMVAEAVH